MKKLMIMLAMVAVATVTAQASTAKWAIGNGSTVVKLNGTTLAGQAIQLYLVGVNGADDVLWDTRQTTNTQLSKGKLASAVGSQTGTYADTAAGGPFTEFNSEDLKYYDLGREYYIVITATGSDNKTYTYTSSAVTSAGLDDKNLAALNFSFTDKVIESGTDGWVAQSVPEPTSGLLLLLGVAGLALKRRRA